MKVYQLIWFNKYSVPEFNDLGIFTIPEKAKNVYSEEYWLESGDSIHSEIIKQNELDNHEFTNIFVIVEIELDKNYTNSLSE